MPSSHRRKVRARQSRHSAKQGPGRASFRFATGHEDCRRLVPPGPYGRPVGEDFRLLAVEHAWHTEKGARRSPCPLTLRLQLSSISAVDAAETGSALRLSNALALRCCRASLGLAESGTRPTQTLLAAAARTPTAPAPVAAPIPRHDGSAEAAGWGIA